MTYDQIFATFGPFPPTPTIPPNLSIVLSQLNGNVLTLSGYGPFIDNNLTVAPYGSGKLGNPSLGGVRSIQDGYAAAKLTGINLLLIAQQALGGTLNNIVQINAVEGFVNSTADFTQQSTVMNGCSDLLLAVFGNAGQHTRSAIGTNTLAFNICVEISMTLTVQLPPK